MSSLVVYRQRRVDEGMRTGIELDSRTIGHKFEEGGEDRDPALRWYVDLRCEGPGLPHEAGAAFKWLNDQEMLIRENFSEYADRLSAGADLDDYPLEWIFPSHPDGVRMKIACSAVRRVDSREISSILKGISREWPDLIRDLEVAEVVNG